MKKSLIFLLFSSQVAFSQVNMTQGLRAYYPFNGNANDVSGKFTVKENGKRYFTAIFVVVVLLATTDIVFALDSIPAVFAISQDRLVIYTSNIFAVLGLRSLFFLLQGAVNQFEYLQHGIAIVLIFIGLKMLAEAVHIYIPVWVSLMVIVVCLFGSILYSVQNTEKEKEE